MNKQEFDQVGGFPMTTKTLSELQKAFTIFNSLGALAGDKTIISGCETVGSLVNDGFVYVAGELFEFRGGGVQTQVKIFEIRESLIFGNNEPKEVIKTRYVSFGSGVGAMNWSDFKRGVETKSLEATFTSINSSLTTIANKLGTIDENAKIQLQADFNQVDNTKKDFIKNKPAIVNYLFKGTYNVGDVTAVDNNRTISFTSVGTSNYIVVGSLVSKGGNWNDDNDVFWMVREKQNDSFKLLLREISGFQDLSFDYILIPL